MNVNIDHRRAYFALTRVQVIHHGDEAHTKKTSASKAIALIKNSGLLKAIDFIKSNLPDIYKDILEWLKQSGADNGPQLSEALKNAATTNRLTEYITNLQTQNEYKMILQESVAFLGWIKLKAEGHKNYLSSLLTESEGGNLDD